MAYPLFTIVSLFATLNFHSLSASMAELSAALFGLNCNLSIGKLFVENMSIKSVIFQYTKKNLLVLRLVKQKVDNLQN